MRRTTLVIGTLIASLGISGQASAVKQERTSFQGAVNNCQAPLPSFEGAFRKRPLGIANGGSSPAFINCALSAQEINSDGIFTVLVLLINRGAASVEVSCTLIDGLASPLGTPSFFPKIFTVAAGQSAPGQWTQADNSGRFFFLPSLSCMIPPGVEINGTLTFYNIDVGA